MKINFIERPPHKNILRKPIIRGKFSNLSFNILTGVLGKDVATRPLSYNQIRISSNPEIVRDDGDNFTLSVVIVD